MTLGSYEIANVDYFIPILVVIIFNLQIHLTEERTYEIISPPKYFWADINANSGNKGNCALPRLSTAVTQNR
jgi:hypothetical protein